MSFQTDKIYKILEGFGLETEECRIYISLLENSPKSALEISKELSLGRTKVYRLLENLSKKGLVNTIVDEYGNKFESNPPSQLEMLLKERETEIQSLKEQSSALFQELDSLRKTTQGETKVLFYKGIEGLKQVTWNSLKSKDGIRIMEINNMEGFWIKSLQKR